MHTGLWFPTYSSTPLMTRSEGRTQGYTTAPMNTFTSFHTLCIITHRVYHIPNNTHSPTVTEAHTLTGSQCHIVCHNVTLAQSHPVPWSYEHTTLSTTASPTLTSHSRSHAVIPQSHEPTASHGLTVTVMNPHLTISASRRFLCPTIGGMSVRVGRG